MRNGMAPLPPSNGGPQYKGANAIKRRLGECGFQGSFTRTSNRNRGFVISNSWPEDTYSLRWTESDDEWIRRGATHDTPNPEFAFWLPLYAAVLAEDYDVTTEDGDSAADTLRVRYRGAASRRGGNQIARHLEAALRAAGITLHGGGWRYAPAGVVVYGRSTGVAMVVVIDGDPDQVRKVIENAGYTAVVGERADAQVVYEAHRR